jgi:hypothetical protein
MKRYGSFTGTITIISDFLTDDQQTAGCYKLISLVDRNGSIVNFVVSPFTYIVDQAMLETGDMAIGFFDTNAPTPLIYPPQYEAIVMARVSPYHNVKVDYFNSQLVSSDGTLKLNISPFTLIVLENGLAFTGNLENRNLIVVYGATTRSIPAQTTPYKIIVLCR